jgi:hypothetical protein
MSAINVNDLGGRHVGGWEPTDTPYVLGVSPGRRLERAAEAVAQSAPDCRYVERKGHVSVPVALMAALQEACE